MKNKIMGKVLVVLLILSTLFMPISKDVDAYAALPATGIPGSTSVEYNSDGTPKRERTYGEDGLASKDVDYNHSGVNHTFPHEHEWDWSKKLPR